MALDPGEPTATVIVAHPSAHGGYVEAQQFAMLPQGCRLHRGRRPQILQIPCRSSIHRNRARLQVLRVKPQSLFTQCQCMLTPSGDLVENLINLVLEVSGRTIGEAAARQYTVTLLTRR